MSQIQDWKLAFIGGGNMGSAIIGGLLAQKALPASNIVVSEPWDVNRQKIESAHGVRTIISNVEATKDADALVLAVKPQVAKAVCQELATSWAGRETLPLIVSIAGGITLKSLGEWFTVDGTRKPKVVRVMPNTPALVGEGACGAIAGEGISEEEKAKVDVLLQAFSKVVEWVDREELIDVVTGLSGSGPAYFFAMVEHMVASAVALGMPQEQAERLAKQTCLGAGKMLVEQSESPAQLRINVTSPNGTTQAALESFNASDFQGVVHKAVKAATDRAEELGKILG
ncbi:pyrroline-5-carboxylate reductase [Rhypophila decipiens]|uniref:Pyrroline-5-carboxylate reductase n=1 Tax=Rhypophila decipiens TaxID=261697 RepID=A0AAN6YKL3_9PEZI|nr:pyrroline-5-carboxylate reductase [Rhypophila decipiens]